MPEVAEEGMMEGSVEVSFVVVMVVEVSGEGRKECRERKSVKRWCWK